MIELNQIDTTISKLQDLKRGSVNDKQLANFERLLDEISTAMSDIAGSIEAKPDEDKALIAQLAKAISAIKLTVSQAPAQVNVEAVMPASPPSVVNIGANQQVGSEWVAMIPGAHGWPDRNIVIRRTK